MARSEIMKPFAKILIVDDRQLLTYVSPDEYDESVTIHNIFEIDNDVFVDAKVMGPLKPGAEYSDVLDLMTQEKAEELVRGMRDSMRDALNEVAVDES